MEFVEKLSKYEWKNFLKFSSRFWQEVESRGVGACFRSIRIEH